MFILILKVHLDIVEIIPDIVTFFFFLRNDQLGIPYTVIVTDVTITDGAIQIRERDSQFQVSGVVLHYINQLLFFLKFIDPNDFKSPSDLLGGEIK